MPAISSGAKIRFEWHAAELRRQAIVVEQIGHHLPSTGHGGVVEYQRNDRDLEQVFRGALSHTS